MMLWLVLFSRKKNSPPPSCCWRHWQYFFLLFLSLTVVLLFAPGCLDDDDDYDHRYHRGKQKNRGQPRPIPMWRVRWRGDASLRPFDQCPRSTSPPFREEQKSCGVLLNSGLHLSSIEQGTVLDPRFFFLLDSSIPMKRPLWWVKSSWFALSMRRCVCV